LSIFHAYGLLNEVREILRRIIKEGISLDRAVVAYTSSGYIPVIYSVARRLGLNVTYGEGISGNLTAPGRVLKGLVEWIRSGYSVRALKDLLLSGDVVLPGSKEDSTVPAPATAARMLVASGIGWGRDRYILLKRMAETFKEKAAAELAEEDDPDSRRQRYLRRSELAEGIYIAVNGLITNLPLPDKEGRIGFRELTSGLSCILQAITNNKSSIDAAALQGLINNLVQAGQFASFNLETEKALERVENILEVFRAGASAPRPGHLHVVSYENLIWSCRPHTFIAGLGADNFPGSGRQDPVLLDSERRLIHPGLALGTDRPSGNQYLMALALASRRGRVTLSFPSFDVVDNRAVFPSNILLQAYRLLQKDTSLDYTDLSKFLGRPAGYCPCEGTPALDETEWWIGKVLTGPGVTNGEETVGKCYLGIDQGKRAIKSRQSSDPTEYDGMIDSDGEFDPRWNNGLVLSCSRIEELAGCPFAYFLKNILRVLPPDELSYDPNCWLNPLERGSLLHEVFCRFMQRIKAKNESPGLPAHKSMLMEMADELIVEYKKRIPVPNDFVFQREVRDIHRSCEVFLAAEETHAAGEPVYFELPFGMGSEALAETGQGLAEPVRIDLGDGAGFLLRGKIDRIDRTGEGVYHVWDYKTGSTYGFDEHRHFRGGRQIQHALYAIAAEQIIKGLLHEVKPRVTISGYYFPTERGEGLRISRPQRANREQVSQLLNNLFDILAEGIFVAADDGERCGVCDYRDVCGGEAAVARAKELASPEGSPLLDSWRRLKNFG
jgi:ATP-dependent helicase/nuclease subunit B